MITTSLDNYPDFLDLTSWHPSMHTYYSVNTNVDNVRHSNTFN